MLQVSVSFLPLAAAFCLSLFTLVRGRGRGWRECSAIGTACGAAVAVALLSQVYHVGGNFREFMMLTLSFALPLIYIFDSAALSGIYCLAMFTQISGHVMPAPAFCLFWAPAPMILFHLTRDNDPCRTVTRYLSVAYVLFGTLALGGGRPLAVFTSTALLFLCGMRIYERGESMWRNPWSLFSFVCMTVLLGIGGCGGNFPVFGGEVSVTQYVLFEGVLLCAFAAILAADIAAKRLNAERMLLAGAIIAGARAEADGGAVVFMNVLLALFGFALVVNGWRRRSALTFNGGLVMASTLLLCRFFDSSFGALPRSAMLILLGAGFLVLNVILARRTDRGDGSCSI